ncbi:MAG: flagellar type III secretion system pore protein FliP [Gemmatimonadaceae bacterium]
MKVRRTITWLTGLLAIASASTAAFAQQTPVPSAPASSTGAVARVLQSAANSTNAATTAASTAAKSGATPQNTIPQPPQILVPGSARGATTATTGPRATVAGAQPTRPEAAKVANGASVNAPVAQTGGADVMLGKLAPQMDLRVGGKDSGGLRLSGTVGIVVMMGLLTLLPTLVLLMTGFTRILIVLNFLRQALGTQNAPPAQLVAALSLILTGFVMAPTLTRVNETALQPWMNGTMDQAEMMKTAVVPFREFMLQHTRDHDLQVFINMSSGVAPQNEDQVPLVTLVSAFATSELRTAFQIGFALFLPFIIIDIVVSSVLMSMGMFMLPPAMISLPFKLLLFVLVDGWTLVVQSLVTSFRV